MTDNNLTARICEQLGRKPRILIVDDEPTLIEVYASVFQRKGYEVSAEADTVVAAQTLLAKATPDVILADLQNKRPFGCGDLLGGLTLYRKLQDANRLPALYMGMTGAEAPKPFQECCTQVFTKPCSLYEMVNDVSRHLGEKIGQENK